MATQSHALSSSKLRASLPGEVMLQELLLPLHAATEIDALWKAIDPLLRAAFTPSVRVTLFLGHFGMREARLVFTDPPILESADWFKERAQKNPFKPYINSHRRITHYRFSDMLGSLEEFRQTDFYGRFASVEGWDLGLSGLMWSGKEMKAMFSIYRKSPQPDFDEEDIHRLNALLPHIETAINRVEKLHGERLHRKALEEFNRFVPIGLILLDWDLNPVFANNEAYKECAVWNFGIEESRTYNTREVFALPPAIQTKCESIRADILRTNPKDKLEVSPELNRLTHPKLSTRRAAITALNASPGLLAKPGFLVVLEDRSSEVEPQGKPAPRKQKLLWMLSPSEREIAHLICAGQSNAEIAKQLKKSILTIKKQITSIFKKTEVSSRSQFMAMLR